MHVLAIGKSAVGTRYIAERDANKEREGTSRRPLFSDRRDDLTPAQANQVLTGDRGKPKKEDLRHIVISPESERAYESLGDTDEERKENFRECTRATLARFAEALGLKDVHWVAGIHLNTDHPHVHILIHKDARDAETGRPRRINHIPKEWLMHNERVAVEPPARQVGPEARAGAEAASEAGQSGASAAEEPPARVFAYRPAGAGVEGFQQFKGTYLSLDRPDSKEGGRPSRRVSVAVEPREIFDPKGVMEGTDRERSLADEKTLLERLEGVPLHGYGETQTAVLVELGYRGAADWDGGERDEKNPARELTVFEPGLVSDAPEEPPSAPEASAPEEPATVTRVNYGRLGLFFKEEIDARAYPVRQIAFHLDHSPDYTRRELLDPRERAPTDTERMVGRWVMMEARQNGHEDLGTRILRLRLREEVTRLDSEALAGSRPRPLAYIPAGKLADAIAENQISVLRADGTLAPRYHSPEPSRADVQRARVYDLVPSHGGQIFGVIAADTRRVIAREVVTVGPHLRAPVRDAVPQPEAPEAGQKLDEVQGRTDLGWTLKLKVSAENRVAVSDALEEVWSESGRKFDFSLWRSHPELGPGITTYSGNHDGPELVVEHRAFASDADEVLLRAGDRETAEFLAAQVSQRLGDVLEAPTPMTLYGEPRPVERVFAENVTGYFSIARTDPDFDYASIRGVPLLKDDYRQLEGVAPDSRDEFLARAEARSDELLTLRYGSFYSGEGEVPAPENERRQPAPAPAPSPADAPAGRVSTSREEEVAGRVDVGWQLTVIVTEERRAEFAARLSELREGYGLRFDYSLWLDKEEGHGITVSASDERGREAGSMHVVRERDGISNEDEVLINAGSKGNAELVAAMLDAHLDGMISEPPPPPIAGEEFEAAFSEKVAGHFQIHAVDPDFTGYTKWGVPFLKEDYERIMSGSRIVASGAGARSLGEQRERAFSRADAVLRERYGAFYAGPGYVAPERDRESPEAEREKPIQGLDGYTHEDVKQIVRDYIRERLGDQELDFEVTDVAVTGSRSVGVARPDSDLDVLVEYAGSEREDDLFNWLNDRDDPLEIEGVRVDINPITPWNSGTIAEYRARHEKPEGKYAPAAQTVAQAAEQSKYAVTPAAPAPYEPQVIQSGKSGWVHVTPDSRCPVCHKPDNCAVSTDGKRAYCRRVESDRQGRDGGYFHDLTKLDGYQPREARQEVPTVVQYEKRPIEDRDRVNRKIMDALSLDERDRAGLLARGLSAEAVERGGYVSVPVRAQANAIAARLAEEGEDLRGVPGFWRAETEEGEKEWNLNLNYWYRGVMVPVTDARGRVEGFQIRRAEVREDEPRYVWLSSKSREDSPKPEGTPSGAPVHYARVEQIRETGEAILTEGSLKSNVISAYLDRGVVGIAGVSVFQDDFGEKLRAELPELRRVWIAYDADAAEKKEVKRALERVTGVLTKAGLEVGQLQWQIEEGKGLDDYLKGKLGEGFNQAPSPDRADRQREALESVGWVAGEIPADRRPTPAVNLEPGMTDASTGHVITEEELTVAEWLHAEADSAEKGHVSQLRSLRDSVTEIDEAAGGEGRPEVAAVMQPHELDAALKEGRLLSREQLVAHQRMLDRIALGDELAARLELVHAGEKYNRCLEQAATRRYRVLDVSTGLDREMSAHDVEQRAQARSYRAVAERADEVERVEPRDRAGLRSEIKEGVVSQDLSEHETTVTDIGRKHAEQLSALDRGLKRAYLEHDDAAPQARAVERAYRARGEELPAPFIPEDRLDRLHEQALERRDADTIVRLEDIRTGIAEERGLPVRDDQQAGRLAGQHNVAQSDVRVAERRREEFRKSKESRKWEIEGETKKWSLAEVDKEKARSERELDYLSASGRFFGSRGIAVQLFKQQVLGRINPINALRPSTLSPLYPIKHHPVVKAVRIGLQVYRWHQRGKEAEQLAQAARENIERLDALRPRVEQRIAERELELQSELTTQTRVADTLGRMREADAAGRALRGEGPATPRYSDWELRRLETNSMELRDGEMLREYERAVGDSLSKELEKMAADIAAGKTPEEAARELVENRIKEAMSKLDPTPKQVFRLAEKGAEVPANRMLASQKIEELTGEEAAWKKAGREAVEALKAGGKPLTPEGLAQAHREAFGSRAVAREIVTGARLRDAAERLARFTEFRDVQQVSYTTAEGGRLSGSLRDVQPRNWLEGIRRWLGEPAEIAAKRESIERALAEEEAKLKNAEGEAREFHDAARSVADDYRASLGEGEELKPQFTSREASELERFGGGLRPDELERLEQMAGQLSQEQATQVEYSRIVQDALAEGRVSNDPGAQPSQRTQATEREADPVERAERAQAEGPELGTAQEAGAAEAEVAADVEVEAEVEEGLSLLL